MVVPGRQEDGASLEQLLDHGWKRVKQGNRLWQPRDRIGLAAPSAPPPVPQGAPWRTRRRSSALRGHQAPSRPGSTAATALPCTGTPHSPVRATAPTSPRSVSAAPGDLRRTSGAVALGPLFPLRLCPVWAWRSPETPAGLAALTSLGSAGGAVPAACRTHVPVWAPGYRDIAGTDTAKALPVAPQPGAALNRYVEMPQPGQTPPTAQKDHKEQLALPGMEARAVCRGAQTAAPVSDLSQLPDIESQAVYLGHASKSEVQVG
ncbi:nascent polypeptide-associated complex subunit alpha, muscle-specific form-like [Melospiza melodia melodia]|uniref:nascent polypeptide-associated complex subunit alpha, muscle-specific form-like n=1 Tax=Melospiza melodia melodia TaxID=1914991 RepID=UPI002FD7945C